MNFLKLGAVAIFAAVAFTACDDSSSAKDSGASLIAPKDIKSYDCTINNGVKVLFPEGGEVANIGDTILVVYASDIQGSGYRFVFKATEDVMGFDMLEKSAGPKDPDGKTCYQQKVVLTEDVAEPTETAVIAVIPYEKTNKVAKSAKFTVTK